MRKIFLVIDYSCNSACISCAKKLDEKSNYNTNLIILSNGRKFKDKSFSKQIKAVGVDRVMTTFYSPYKEKHDMITRIKGSFLDTVEGLKNLEDIETNFRKNNNFKAKLSRTFRFC